MNKFVIVLTMFGTLPLFAQFRHDYIWQMGYGSTNNHPQFGITRFDFGMDTLSPFKDSFDMRFYLTDGNICDGDGNLLFYTNGCWIANAENQVMMGGEKINDNGEWELSCGIVDGYAVNKGVVILPQPGHPDIYYLFHIPLIVYPPPQNLTSDRLLYTIVDMSLDNGLGGVVESDVTALEDFLHTSDLAAVKHANGQDWWIVIPRRGTNVYNEVLLTENGIEGVFEKTAGDSAHINGIGGGQATFSPNGKKYARYNNHDEVLLFDFDNETGELSNFLHLTLRDTPYIGGVAFSPNNRFLYATSELELWQFDLEASDIQSSKTLIYKYDGDKVNNIPTTYYAMQLGPDCRIYIVAPNGVPSMHVIQHPDLPGLACGFEQNGLPLPTYNAASQPNFPNYRLGTPYPVCDSSIVLVTSAVPVLPRSSEIKVWPNPASGEVRLALPVLLAQPGVLALYNGMGQVVRREALAKGLTEQAFSVAGLAPGLYFWEARAGGERLGEGKVVVGR